MGEFDLIDRFFRRPAASGADGVALGIGDDCALLAPSPGMQLAVSSDLLLEGRHFLPTADPAGVGHKALAVNLSDLAACGATPLAFTLALALPHADAAWLEPFSRGLLALAASQRCALVGGDTTRGPLAICITVFGQVPPGQALLRSGAQVGDDIWVSGTLGDARLALEVFRGKLQVPGGVFEAARLRMDQPQPRLALGQALRGVATAAIDVSDGLLGDLGHVLRQSGVGARVEAAQGVELLGARQAGFDGLSGHEQLRLVLGGGDDYELAFTAPPARRDAVVAAGAATRTPVTRIGSIEAGSALRVVDARGAMLERAFPSFDHFA